MEKHRVLITGLGTVNPLGHNAADTWQAVRDGVYSIDPATRYDCSAQKVHLATEVRDWDPIIMLDRKNVRHMNRCTQLAAAAAKETLADSGLGWEKEDPTRCGITVSSGVGGIEMAESEELRCSQKGLDRASSLYIPAIIASMGAGFITIMAGFQGMCTCPVTACAGGSNAVGDAFRHIRGGYAEVMLRDGVEVAITPLSTGGFTTMRALHMGDDPSRASIPFNAERSGFVMGEGAAVLMLEEYGHALARRARMCVEVVGYGATRNVYHITAPIPNGEGGARVMALALAGAGASPEQVGYINARGTPTPLNDSREIAAIRAVLGVHAAKSTVSSTKSMTGHMLGAAGAVEVVFTALALRGGFLPATIHYQVPDPTCDLDHISNQSREQQVEYVLSNSLGSGGHNACVLFKKWEGWAMMQLNSNQIAEIIPHRYPLALMDRIVDGEVGKWAKGVKCVTVNEPFSQGHFPQYHVVPGVPIIEALAQVGAVTMLSMPENKGRIGLFGGIKNVRFRRQVTPGDVLELEYTILKQKGPVAVAEAKATVGDQLAISAELTFALTKDL